MASIEIAHLCRLAQLALTESEQAAALDDLQRIISMIDEMQAMDTDGVEPLALWEAVRQGARGRVRTFDSLGDHFLINDYDPAKFALKLAHKDVSLATELGRDVGVPMRSLGLTQAEMSEALNRGWGERDSRVSMLLQLERAGVDLAVDKAAIRAILEADE